MDSHQKQKLKEKKQIDTGQDIGSLTPATMSSTPLTTASGAAVSHIPAAGMQQTRIDQAKIAGIISKVLHPFIISPLSIILILWLDQGNLLTAIGWAALCAAFVVVPALLYLRDKLKQKAYTDADVSVREHRYGFYLFGGACMSACFATLIWLDAPTVLIAGFTAALCALVVAAIVNRFWTKVSIHAGAMAGVAAAAAFYSIPLAVLLVAGTLAVSWARLVTKRHTAGQAIVAWVIATVCVGGVFGPMLNM